MPNGVIQLVAYGAEDLYLTGNPQMTYWKMVYKRHTNFAMEYIIQYFTGTLSVSTTENTIFTCKIDRNADLIHDMYLVFDLPNLYSNIDEPVAWVKNVGQNLIYSAEITFNGQRADIQYGIWMNIWNELTLPDDKRPAYDRMIGNVPYMQQPLSISAANTLVIPRTRLYIPLNFWFCRNSGLAIPLIALQSTFVYINIELNPLNNIFVVGFPQISPQQLFNPDYINSDVASAMNKQIYQNVINDGFGFNTLLQRYTYNIFSPIATSGVNLGTPIPNQQLYLDVNYIYLDDEERRRFAQVEHEYLITQVQQRVYPGLHQGPNTIDFSDIQHPTRELMWILRRRDVQNNNDWNNYTLDYRGKDLYELIALLANRFQEPTLSSLNVLNPTNVHATQFFLNYLQENHMTAAYASSTYYTNYTNIMETAEILFNGNRRMEVKPEIFFSALQPYKYHTSTNKLGIYVFSFAIDPEKDNPTGTCNFSRIQKSQMNLTIKNREIPTEYDMYFYAVNYNVLRITGGIGGTVFSM
jgi:hypothetical protein